MEKNKFKKQNAQGDRLPEEIGKGINEDHLTKVREALKNDSIQTFKIPEKLKNEFAEVCDNPSEVLRALVRGYVSLKKIK